jgi:aminopeptidase N
LQLLLLPGQVAARFDSPRPWLQDGLARFLQVKTVENRSGRRAALEYLDDYRGPLAQAEAAAHPTTPNASASSAADNTLLNTNDEVYLRGKGGFVFWMLHDMVGDEALQHALATYRGGADKEPSYFQRLVQASAKRDLEWFFDDWVYRDRGLPDLDVTSVYPRPLLSEAQKNYMVTATIENRGHAGAEVPVIIQTPSGEKSVRVLVKAGEKAAGRIEVPVPPAKIVVNDGSVPESKLGNNEYDVPAPQQ